MVNIVAYFLFSYMYKVTCAGETVSCEEPLCVDPLPADPDNGICCPSCPQGGKIALIYGMKCNLHHVGISVMEIFGKVNHLRNPFTSEYLD